MGCSKDWKARAPAALACLGPQKSQAAIGVGAGQRCATRRVRQARAGLAHLQQARHAVGRRNNHHGPIWRQLQAPDIILRHAHLRACTCHL